jgi:hypothetical protein
LTEEVFEQFGRAVGYQRERLVARHAMDVAVDLHDAFYRIQGPQYLFQADQAPEDGEAGGFPGGRQVKVSPTLPRYWCAPSA